MLKNILILSGLLFALPANATFVTYEYSGLITSLYEADCINDINGECEGYITTDLNSSNMFSNQMFSKGNYFRGSFTVDNRAILSDISSDGHQAIYLNAIQSESFRLETYFAPTSDMPIVIDTSLSIVDGRNGTDVFQTNTYFSNADWFSGLTISLQDNSNRVFNELTIPNLLDQNSFSYMGFGLFFLDLSSKSQLQISGTISSIVISKDSIPVPLPATLGLFCIGLLILTTAKNRKS
ncbi:hypothetical protein [Alishewanella sp. HL-SH05]|uniref:hypothetical protein n=1 Tax=Alishewanella sp. HL-SH05 TaxID=3461145 RepID=UPI00404333D5